MAGQRQGGQWQPEENVQPHVQRQAQFPPFSESPGQYGQQPYPPQYPPPPQFPYPPPRKSRRGILGIGCLGLFGLIVLAGALTSHSSSAPPAALPTLPTAAVSQQPAPASSAAAAKAVTVATFSGSGAGNTPPFTTGATWKLSYSFDCSGFGYKGNFMVYDYGSDGIPHGVMANDLAMSKSGSSWSYDDPGTHHLNVNSECSWAVKVTDEG